MCTVLPGWILLIVTAPCSNGLKLTSGPKVADSPYEGMFDDERLFNGTYAEVNAALAAVADHAHAQGEEANGPEDFFKKCTDMAWGKCDFLGGPAGKFVPMGKSVLARLQQIGMQPSSRVLEVGMGLGRSAYYVIDFLDIGGFSGIEPNVNMLAFGVAHLLGKTMLDRKKPTFWTSSDCDFHMFGNEFDFVFSRSVWTHMSKKQIERYMSAFKNMSHSKSKLLTSISKVTEDCSHDYLGEDFLGKSNHSNVEALATHCMPWLRQTSAEHGLELEWENPVPELGQYWILLRHTQNKSVA